MSSRLAVPEQKDSTTEVPAFATEQHAVIPQQPCAVSAAASVETSPREIRVNGERRNTRSTNLAAFLSELGLSGRPVAVELNRIIVLKENHAETMINADDSLEIIQFVGGG